MTENKAVTDQLVAWQTEWMSKYNIDYYRVDTVKHVETTTWAAFKNSLTKVNPDFKMIGEYSGAGYANNAGELGTGTMDALCDRKYFQRGKFTAEEKQCDQQHLCHGKLFEQP